MIYIPYMVINTYMYMAQFVSQRINIICIKIKIVTQLSLQQSCIQMVERFQRTCIFSAVFWLTQEKKGEWWIGLKTKAKPAHVVTSTKQSPIFKGSIFCPVIENCIWIQPLLRDHLFYKATFSLSQRWQLHAGLTVFDKLWMTCHVLTFIYSDVLICCYLYLTLYAVM